MGDRRHKKKGDKPMNKLSRQQVAEAFKNTWENSIRSICKNKLK